MAMSLDLIVKCRKCGHNVYVTPTFEKISSMVDYDCPECGEEGGLNWIIEGTGDFDKLLSDPFGEKDPNEYYNEGDKPMTEREMELTDQMNDYYERDIHLGFINRLERLIGVSETLPEDWECVDVRSLSHLILLACVRIERLTDELEKSNESR